MPWLDSWNAQVYEEYALKYPMYRELAKKMVEVAGIGPGMTVVDLACGTGVVTEQILAKLTGKGRVIGVDKSGAMLDIARKNLPEVEFVEAPAEALHEVVSGASVDAVVCNSAFWQMDVGRTVEEIAQVLKPEGCFVFNLAEAHRLLNTVTSPYLGEIMKRIAIEEYGYVQPPQGIQRRRLESREEVVAFLAVGPLALRAEETMEVEHTAESVYAFRKIPVMIESLLPSLDYATGMEILEKAYQRFDQSYTSRDVWRFYMTGRREG